ncbi:fungal specific transcription factor domain-containing protein [Aspergillus mulundensis]|uniref:C6 transcription factor n=1 Tax=Aspergillus mulundensis TaxID=1810919 RepID=A0A3D8QEZ7_9EURO|nr:hypothetical protein DSM5745_10853 [Aspergillus mulundensis]RDW60395.1 hypothetical protein DSM5745_10853 [Aspergillus mulundensis]
MVLHPPKEDAEGKGETGLDPGVLHAKGEGSAATRVNLGLTCEGYSSLWAAPLGPAHQAFKNTGPVKYRGLSSSPAPSLGSIASSGTLEQTFSAADHISAVSPPPTEQDDASEAENCSRDLVPLGTNQTAEVVQVTSTTPSKLISHLSNLDTHYLQYHMERGSKLLANLETDENPLRSLIIPRALSSPLLMNALCALSAIHFSNRAHYSWSAENEGANYYIDTMRGLRTTLAVFQGSSVPDDAILAVSLLCKYEIVRGSVKQWAVHLDALQTLVVSRGGLTQLAPETAEFIRGLFVYANSLAKLTDRKTLLKPPIPVFDIAKPRKLDIYIGYTEEIIKTCARIADLPNLASDPVALGLEVKMIDKLLHTWTSTKTTYIVPKGITQATLSRLRLVAESFRDAAYIYLHSVLEQMTTFTSSPNPIRESKHPISVSKTSAITSLLTRLKIQPIDKNCEFSALTFPLFIAGCETNSKEDREFVLDMLSVVEKNFGIGNVKRAKEVLGLVWGVLGENGVDGDGKTHWADVLDGLGWDLILA